MSRKRLSTEMQSLAWQLQLAPQGAFGRAHHESLIERLGLCPGEDAGRRTTFNQLRQRAAIAATQLQFTDAEEGTSSHVDERGSA